MHFDSSTSNNFPVNVEKLHAPLYDFSFSRKEKLDFSIKKNYRKIAV